MKPLVSIHQASLHLKLGKFVSRILNNISLDIFEGECLSLVGESGSGKTSLAHVLVGLTALSSGKIVFHGDVHCEKNGNRGIQIIFQDIGGSLNPKMTVSEIILESLVIAGKIKENETYSRFREIMEIIELPLSLRNAYPKELSGGQKQRLSIGRGLISRPRLLICDEPLSSLDSIRQAHIMNVFRTIKKDLNITILFISHDLTAVHSLSDRIAVIHRGSLVEVATRDELFLNPRHYYTQELLRMIPDFCYYDFSKVP
ncbi:MAG: ATP-binding cassette domain-containing protein [Victivallaceae bacterium]